jgi:hypothetical protein
MPKPWERKTIDPSLHELLVMDCPIELLDFAARLVGGHVSVENLRPMKSLNQWYTSRQALFPDDPVDSYSLKNVRLDVALTLGQFLFLMPRWDQNGVYAVFSPKGPVKFRATDMESPGRYSALKQYDFQLEFALAGPSSSGQSGLVSPKIEVIDQCEQFLVHRT